MILPLSPLLDHSQPCFNHYIFNHYLSITNHHSTIVAPWFHPPPALSNPETSHVRSRRETITFSPGLKSIPRTSQL